MKVYQTNEINKGIFVKEVNESFSLQEQVESGYWGYRHGDALWFEEDKHITYRKLAQRIVEKYPNVKNILEIGCGAGSMSNHIRDLNQNVNVITLDGNQETINSPYIKKEHHFIVLTDSDYFLKDENQEIIKFDLILSFEHFEHIHPDRFDCFLENIKRHSKKETIIIATASTWAEGRDHCNVKTKEEWDSYLDSKGFDMIDDKIINGVVPFNFAEESSSELIFKIK